MKSARIASILAVGICLLLLAMASVSRGNDAVASIFRNGLVEADASSPGPAAGAPGALREANPRGPCLPRYGEPQFIFRVNDTSPLAYEPVLTSGDLNDDGLADVIITRVTFQKKETYELDILLNDGQGSLMLATSSLFTGAVPAVQNSTQTLIADFNGDGMGDIFVADHGYDAPPFPGYQNTLVLSTSGGKLVDATGNLPQQSDFTHSVCTADIDGDKDLDLYPGQYWGQNDIDPQILLNNGQGVFSVGEDRLPPLVDLNHNGYTTCAFADVNNDGSPDLVLGDGGDEIDNEHSTPNSEVLLNDGTGVFAPLANAMPPQETPQSDIAHDIEPLDLNGDVYVDLLIVYERQPARGSYIQALVNKGDGTFRDESAARVEPVDRQVWIPRLELRDMNRDGALDLLARGDDYLDPDPILLLNDGAGHFRQKTMQFGLGYLYYTFLDLQGDGGHDLAEASSAPPEDIFLLRDFGCPTYLPLATHKQSAGN